MNLSNLKPHKGSSKRRKVVGRGVGSGHGTFSGRGAKGQKARAGASIPIGFEGGRMPLHRQLPKMRGFKSRYAKSAALSLTTLNDKFNNGETVNPKILFNKGIIASPQQGVKVLGDGELKKSLTFEQVSVSAKALEKITKAGGKINQTHE